MPVARIASASPCARKRTDSASPVDYSLGFQWLFVLSVTHIYLEFPLNHISIIGTFREARGLFGKPLQPAPVGSGKSRKAAAAG